jgi:aryl-alcohol dehydrogenase-like predicted oxidoreductase
VELRRLGKSGLQVSEVGLGCNNFGMKIDRETTHKVVDKAVELGVTLFDAADIYGKSGGSETMLGQILASGASRSCAPPSSGCRWTGRECSWVARDATSWRRQR